MKQVVLAKKSSKLYICFSKQKMTAKNIDLTKVILFKCETSGDPRLLSKQISKESDPTQTRQTPPPGLKRKPPSTLKALPPNRQHTNTTPPTATPHH